jgi:hypothetical protein
VKRIITIAAIAAAAAIALPAVSTAGTDQVNARGGQNFSLTFEIRSNSSGKPVAIKNFAFDGFTVRCNRGERFEVFGSKPSMAVNQFGEFQGALSRGDGQIFIEGDVRQNGNLTVGTLSASGRFFGGRGCTGFTRWEARPGR